MRKTADEVKMMAQSQLERINNFYKKHNKMPSVREVQKLFEYKNIKSATMAIDRLVKENQLFKDDFGRLIPPSIMKISIPVWGYVKAGKVQGFPNPSDEELIDVMDLTEYLEQGIDPIASRTVRVQGRSMEDVGMLPEDVLLVECTDKWRYGNIVIARVDGDMLVKTIRQDKTGRTFLESAGTGFEDIYPEEFEVVGVVKKLIRNY